MSQKGQAHYSSWLNTAVLFNIYSYLSFRDIFTFRLVNQTISHELNISSSSENELFFMNRILKIKKEVSDKSCEFLHGCLLKINAEIRNNMINSRDVSYFGYLFENDENFVTVCMNDEWRSLFMNGKVSFDSFIGGLFSHAQGGRSDLKILKKSIGNEREYIVFSQHFVYGPNTRTYKLDRVYNLIMRDSNNIDEQKELIHYENMYSTYEDENGKIDTYSITQIMKELDIPSDWNWKDFLNFLMTCSGAKNYCCISVVKGNSNIMEDMIKEAKLIEQEIVDQDEDDQDYEEYLLESESNLVKEGSKYLEEIIKPIIQSNFNPSQQFEHFHWIRNEILKISSNKSINLFSSFDLKHATINESMFSQLKSKLKYFTIHESYCIGFTEYFYEERIYATAMFERADANCEQNLSEISFEYTRVGTYAYPSTKLILKLNGTNVNISELIEEIMEMNEENANREMLIQDFSKIILQLFGQCHRSNIIQYTMMTFETKFHSIPLKDVLSSLPTI